jgi:methionine sulfoxide reductase heme-binding subunit
MSTASLATRPPRGFVAGWSIVGWAAIGIAVMTIAILSVLGTEEHGLRFLIRASALTSLLFFSAAFSASSAQQIWRAPWSRWLLSNRRYLGVSFAVSHTIHLVAILTLARVLGDEFQVGAVTLVAGSLAYVVLFLMTATSFDRSAAWIGRRAWLILHRTGAYYLWFVFFVTYLPSAMKSASYVPHVLILLAALGLRAYARWAP